MMMKAKKKVYFADLTYTGNVLSSNVHPLGIGLIASYCMKHVGDRYNFELFKYPEDLAARLDGQIPDIIGFTNYSWSLNISYEFARVIKERAPDTLIIFGGPNYGIEDEEMEEFWQRYPLLDVYITKEGEQATVELLSLYEQYDYSFNAIRQERADIPNCHYTTPSGEIIKGTILPRIDIAELPSPYLLGLMDKFFDHKLIPMTHTSRGCPFTCTFCAEGANYYNKVKHRTDLKEELEYIAERVKGKHDLFITDANFGMYREDIKKAELIHMMQEKYGYPKFIHVSSGKNKKDRVLEVAKLVDGAMRGIAASLQSTDDEVLNIVNRKNISLDALKEIAGNANDADNTSYTEIILGLPGDSKKSHFKSLRDVVDADMGIVRQYQALMLPQTEMSTPTTRNKFGLKTRFRLMPRSFGKYYVLGKTIYPVEVEEIVVESDSMTFDNYLECRELNLTIEILQNGNLFDEIKFLLEHMQLHWFDFILEFYHRRHQHNRTIAELYDEFASDNQDKIWQTKDEVISYVRKNMDALLNNKEGTNEMSRGKSKAFFLYMSELHDAVFETLEIYLRNNDQLSDKLQDYIRELKIFSLMKKSKLLQDNEDLRGFSYDFAALSEQNFMGDPLQYKIRDNTRNYRFFRNDEQKSIVNANIESYGETIDGLSRMIMFRVHYRKLYRSFMQEAV